MSAKVTGVPAGSTSGGGTIVGSTGAADNRAIRSNGAGGSTIQSSDVVIADTGSITIPAAATINQAPGGDLHSLSFAANALRLVNVDGVNVALSLSFANLTADRVASMPDVAGTVVVGSAAGTTVGAAGAASLLPAAPLGYLTVTLPNGTLVNIPYYTP